MSSITSAGQRRRAYQCLKCWHRSDKVFIEARYRVFNHFLKEHVSLDAVPYYCKWCLFRAFKREDLDRHVNGYPRHQAVLREKGVSDSADFLVENRYEHAVICTLCLAEIHGELAQTPWLSDLKFGHTCCKMQTLTPTAGLRHWCPPNIGIL